MPRWFSEVSKRSNVNLELVVFDWLDRHATTLERIDSSVLGQDVLPQQLLRLCGTAQDLAPVDFRISCIDAGRASDWRLSGSCPVEHLQWLEKAIAKRFSTASRIHDSPNKVTTTLIQCIDPNAAKR